MSTGNVLDRLTDGARAVLDDQLDRRLDAAIADALPAPVELGLGVHRDRALVVRRGGPAGARSLFRAQWADGRVPHIVFNPSVAEDAYFPGPAFWESSKRSPQAPRDVETSGITQPSIHARAALEMHRHARDVEASKAFLAWLYPHLAAEHAYLDGPRSPRGPACRW